MKGVRVWIVRHLSHPNPAFERDIRYDDEDVMGVILEFDDVKLAM